MKPIISDVDYIELGHTLTKDKSREANIFRKILLKYRIVKDSEFSNKTVRLNSVVHFWSYLLKRLIKFRIVLPSQADLKSRKVSVFAPISQALLGYKEKDIVHVEVPGISKQFKIIKVLN